MQVIDDQSAAPQRNWNHNAAYYRFARRRVPPGSRDLLDVGCGDGQLARGLAGPGRRVLGLDPSPEMVAAARAGSAGITGLAFEQDDFLTREIPEASYDFVSFVASLQHMDQGAALAKAAKVLRPGGRLVVIGLARDATKADMAVAAIYAPLSWFGSLRPDFANPEGMPIKMPELSWRETRELARRALPGARLHRRVYWRYTLAWTKPSS